jgi:(2Fe-2S) ferredoxin/SAM-dependent methyltransferase
LEPFRFHLFVCTQQKPEGVNSCTAGGSLAVVDELNRQIRERGLSDAVQLTTCGCMGLCDEGPIMVVYPEGVWYRRIQVSDVAEIVERHLGHEEPVERLVWRDASAMKTIAVDHEGKFRSAMEAREKAGTLPENLNQLIRGFMPSRCLLTALELDLFTAVGDGASAEQAGARIDASTRATAMLLNALVALGLLSKSGDTYKNTPESGRFFVQGSKDNHRNGLLHNANIWHRWSTLTEAVRRGGSMPIDRARTPEWTKDFIAGMQHHAKDRAPHVVNALGTANVRRILDLGGGSGIYSIAFAQANPEVKCEILDLPDVVPLTSEYVNRAGVQSQVSIRAGDMLHDDFGSGYDIVMLNAICHMFSEEQNRHIFRRARAALAPNGRLVVQDFILNPDKTGPLHAVLFSINMLVGTESGASYSEQEYIDWMRGAGLADVRRIKLPGPGDLIVGVTK